MSHSGSFPSEGAANISITLSSLCSREEEESTDHVGGSVSPRKWTVVILPWLVKMKVIQRKSHERDAVVLTWAFSIPQSWQDLVYCGRTWGCILTLNSASQHVKKKKKTGTSLQVKSRQTPLKLSISFGMVSRLNSWADVLSEILMGLHIPPWWNKHLWISSDKPVVPLKRRRRDW